MQISYKSHIALPYKHSKLAEIAKLQPGTSEKEDAAGSLRALCYKQGSRISHFVSLFGMNVAFSLIPEKLKICSIHCKQNFCPKSRRKDIVEVGLKFPPVQVVSDAILLSEAWYLSLFTSVR